MNLAHLIRIILGIGLGIGSTYLLHGLIYALPLNIKPFKKTLHCAQCQHPRRGLAGIPLLGSILYLGRCTNCRSIYPLGFLLIDMGTPIFIAWAVITLPTTVALEIMLAFTALIAISAIDKEHWIIPNILLVPVLLAGCVYVARFPAQLGFQLLGVVPTSLLLIVIMLIQKYFIKQPGLGMGDLKLVIVAGFWLGPLISGYALFMASFVALIMWFAVGLRTGLSLKRPIQFGSFIALSAWVFGMARIFDPNLSTTLLTWHL